MAKAGSFDLPQGPGLGGAAGSAKAVASAGFGDEGTRAFRARTQGAVKSAGFGDAQTQAATTPNPAPTRVPVQTPVEIISKPRPLYTPEARAGKLEGEVLLEVVFSAAGAVHVVKVVRGLGLGLDESAWQAASQIRFRPGTRDGVPVDMKGIVHIVFELS
jgi:TonB family protein